jgi:cytochrome oxidase assembly protein ShyY1
MGFLLSRRWLLFAVAVALAAYGCLLLGQWQFHRLHDREQRNDYTRENLARPPVPVDTVMSRDRGIGEQAEWTRVRATGRYDAANTVVVRYQVRDGTGGVDVVTPLLTGSGTAVLVDRGWVRTGNIDVAADVAPAPPAGQVTVVGWVRADATGDSTTVTDHSVRSISSKAIGKDLPYPAYDGFVAAQSETPPAAKRLAPTRMPDLGNGPHFFYGLQWWFFGVLAVFGFGYFAYDERNRLRESRTRRAGSPADPTVQDQLT